MRADRLKSGQRRPVLRSVLVHARGTTLAKIALLIWAAAVLAVGATLTAPHLTTLPAPPVVDPTLTASLARIAPAGQAVAVHLLGAECGCSRDVWRSLAERDPVTGVREHVVLVGRDPAAARALQRRGYGYEEVAADTLDVRFGVEAVPLLVVRDATGVVRYAAGYTRRKRDRDIRAATLVAAAASGLTPDPLPTFGCAVGASLRAQLDPLGLR